MPIEIAMVSTFPPMREGIARYTLELSKALLNSKKIQMTVLGSKTSLPRPHVDVPVKTVWTRNSLRYVFTISCAVIRTRAKIVHIQHEYMLYGDPFYSGLFPLIPLLLRLLKRKVIITMHSVIPKSALKSDFLERYGGGKSFSLFKKISTFGVTRLIGSFANAIIVHNKLAKRELTNSYGLGQRKIHVVPHGNDFRNVKLDPNSAKTKLGLKGHVILYFGFVKPGKGVEYAIRSLPPIIEKYPDTKLVIAGEHHPFLTPNGVEFIETLKKIADELSLEDHIVFTGRFLSEEELPQYLSAADVFVLPYTERDIIGASGVVSTISTYGRPIIVTRVPRFCEIKNGETALVVRPADAADLTRAIDLLFSNPALGKRISRALKSSAMKNNWNNVSRAMLSVYQEVLRNA